MYQNEFHPIFIRSLAFLVIISIASAASRVGRIERLVPAASTVIDRCFKRFVWAVPFVLWQIVGIEVCLMNLLRHFLLLLQLRFWRCLFVSGGSPAGTGIWRCHQVF